MSEQWPEWQPRTRASATEALARFISIAVDPGAKSPDGLRVYLQTALAPGTDGGHSVQHERWMAKHCLTLRELDRERVADIDPKLGLKLDGSQLAANTTSRIRIAARASVQSAIDAGAVAVDAWPQRSKTRARRKVARTKRSIDIRSFPSPAVMAEAIDAIVTHQPASKTYRVMTAVAYYAGSRRQQPRIFSERSERSGRSGRSEHLGHRPRESGDHPYRGSERSTTAAPPSGWRCDPRTSSNPRTVNTAMAMVGLGGPGNGDEVVTASRLHRSFRNAGDVGLVNRRWWAQRRVRSARLIRRRSRWLPPTGLPR